MILAELSKKISRAEGQLQVHEESLALKNKYLKSKKLLQIAIDEAHIFLQTVARETQEHLKFHIEDIVNLAIDTVFPDKYQFKVDFEIKRGQTEARIFLLNSTGEEIDPMDDSGGGIVDITAFALRIATWTLSKTSNTILLDEPARFVSKDLQPLFGDILKILSERLDLQIIMVTHSDSFIDVADRIFKVTQKKGISNVETM